MIAAGTPRKESEMNAKFGRRWGWMLAPLVMLAGCQQGGNGLGGNEQLFGALVGGAAGGLLGSQVASGDTQIATALAGTVIGAYLGYEIARRLTAEDKTQLATATEDALRTPEPGEPVEWENPESGNSGTVTAGDVYVRPAAATTESPRPCRDVEQTIVLADGTSERVSATACQTEDGAWELAA
jgi:surface antigen